jgi:Fe-S-cluster containining protein
MDLSKVVILEAIYAQLPKIECKGLCHHECTYIALTELEAERIEDKVKRLPVFGSLDRCELLDKENRCEAYDVRPLICRLYGLEESMVCPHGCQPERMLTSAEGDRFLSIVAELSPMHAGSMKLADTIRNLMKGSAP